MFNTQAALLVGLLCCAGAHPSSLECGWPTRLYDGAVIMGAVVSLPADPSSEPLQLYANSTTVTVEAEEGVLFALQARAGPWAGARGAVLNCPAALGFIKQTPNCSSQVFLDKEPPPGKITITCTHSGAERFVAGYGTGGAISLAEAGPPPPPTPRRLPQCYVDRGYCDPVLRTCVTAINKAGDPPVSCAADAHACAAGQVCSAFNKACVTQGTACTSFCGTSATCAPSDDRQQEEQDGKCFVPQTPGVWNCTTTSCPPTQVCAGETLGCSKVIGTCMF
jgi:hypothetical protein